MIIDRYGNVLQGWLRVHGPIVRDTDNKYGEVFDIGVDYNEEEQKCYLAIKELKSKLKATDYKALKFADGAYTEEEYAPYRAERAAWRAEINKIQEHFSEPTLTREEIDEAERLVMEKPKEDTDDNTDDES